MVSDWVATYSIDGKTYKVYGCRNREVPAEGYDFWDVYLDTGAFVMECVNRIDPFLTEPTRESLMEFLAADRPVRQPTSPLGLPVL